MEFKFIIFIIFVIFIIFIALIKHNKYTLKPFLVRKNIYFKILLIFRFSLINEVK
jgi:hypothetical protein